MNSDMTFWVCTMLWNSLAGWDNRPDYFEKNDLMLLGDLAYRAQVDGDAMAAAVGESKCVMNICELVTDFEYGKHTGLLDYLRKVSTDEMEPPFMCDLSDYLKEPTP